MTSKPPGKDSNHRYDLPRCNGSYLLSNRHIHSEFGGNHLNAEEKPVTINHTDLQLPKPTGVNNVMIENRERAVSEL
jgi:hypothetical protein